MRAFIRATPIPAALLTACGLLGIPMTPAHSQSAEERNVETIESTELGPYRPQHEPEIAQVERLIRRQTNSFRKNEGLEKIESNQQLQQTAKKFARYMARTDRYGHTANGDRPSERAKQQGYDYCIVTENIAYQFRTSGFPTKELAEQFVTGWKNSPPHRKNMLDPDVTEIGVGVAQSEKTGAFYAVQMFGRPQSQAIEFKIVNQAGEEVRYRIGNKQFTLPARFIRRHQVCRRPKLILQPGTDEKQSPITPADGQQFVVEKNAEGKLSIQRSASPARP